MHRILVAGAGHIGSLVAELLTATDCYRVTIVDRDELALARLRDLAGVETLCASVTDHEAMVAAMHGCFAVLSAAPYAVTGAIARAAHAAGVHYLDLTEDVATTRLVKALASDATHALIPQCGLAPGFISIVGMELARRFDTLDSLRLRVGALPQFPSNALGYNLTWSTAGVINEYCQPCEAIVDGRRMLVPPLEQLEHFALEGVQYEAFNTSGGLGTLCDTLEGQVRHLNYRTIRYPGHRDAMQMLLQDLRLAERPGLLAELLEHALPETPQDVVVIFATATGRRGGRTWQESFAHRVHPTVLAGREWTAIQVTTASSICAVLDLLAEGRLPDRGFLRQEDIRLADFLGNRFGRVYASDGASADLPGLAPLRAAS
ncbi:MAG: saccharopine dehydrogenase C-terminal domain-containing protein [Steroidobacteraceae bacterium]|nr:saccharopine dehydrogenase NADP-binding domain-containing protein [Nevskiaceae bacterium]MCP5339222.1 saccharopine dehydrogenase NADP-binding domain-containing protein [Nevskiaceae bacterium]MCP5359437.1 saccharopine dehydrogenase NADP-binding domain-containing protein [Nevskiaceae bacterium]MCP5467300.1 saccharopine dehydrogenase NADP-binding domain-containing protein [Nevskiaceae bacterium]MCP5470868.1 saccharopine dehydrogenase NADP-binding domain-containing protein [Nevskiaceae bacterium